jgi:hypothetical protein
MNTFRDKTLRTNYDAAVLCFETKHRDLFYPDGTECHGSSFASYFWKGFHGVSGKGLVRFDAASKKTLAYAFWRAGQDCAKKDRV